MARRGLESRRARALPLFEAEGLAAGRVVAAASITVVGEVGVRLAGRGVGDCPGQVGQVGVALRRRAVRIVALHLPEQEGEAVHHRITFGDGGAIHDVGGLSDGEIALQAVGLGVELVPGDFAEHAGMYVRLGGAGHHGDDADDEQCNGHQAAKQIFHFQIFLDVSGRAGCAAVGGVF